MTLDEFFEGFEPSPDRFMHHLEVWHAAGVDDEARARLAEAGEEAAGASAA